MAIRKDKPAAAGRKAAPPAPRAAVGRSAAPQSAASPQQLMREAAWSRMFGRADAKNPFTR